jgi:TetR/AcrR family transcriptional regulator, transcriptional repressor for nem operon
MFKNIFSCTGKAFYDTERRGGLVPYPPGHSEQTRKKIIQSARKLFNRLGFDNVSINQIMADAGLTRGAFYNHFDSKSDLYAEVLGCFFTDPGWNDSWEGVHVDLKATDLGRQIIRAYLSRQHLESRDNACPMVALPSDVARSGASAKRAFETVFKAMVSTLERGLKGDGHPPRTVAQAIAALCVGGMVLARAINDRTAANELCDASMAIALKLGGWDNSTKLNSGKGKRRRTGARNLST